MEIKGILPEKTKEKRYVMLALSLVMIYLSYESGQYIYIPLVILLIGAIFMKKEHVVSPEGVDIRYHVFGFKTVNRWTWDQITAMQPDYRKAAPNVQILFEKSSVLRSFVFTKADAARVMEMTKRMSPEAYVDDYTEEEQEEIERNKIRAREQAKAERAKARKKK